VPDLATIFNLALGHVGEGTVVSDPDEQTTVARVCRRAWETARDSVLAEHPWLWARRVVTLAEHTPAPGLWVYSYIAPVDAITILGVTPTWWDDWASPATGTVYWTDGSGLIYSTSSAVASLAQKVRWSIGGVTDSGGLDTSLILSDTPLTSATITRRVENPGFFPPIFVDAVSWRLAFEIALPISRSSEVRGTAWSAYQQKLAQAATMDARQRRDSEMPDAEAILARGW
jgi:hypothetical protein